MKKLLFVFAAATAVAASAATFEELRARCEKKVSSLTLDEKCRLLMNAAPEVKHAGISAYDWWNEALHGVGRHVRSTMFPMPIGMAASFDPELIREVGDAISAEARIIHKTAVDRNYHGRYSGLTFWSPNVNIFRDPRWGRGMETWGEDPYLTGRMGVAFIRGMQGDDPVYLKVSACAKHFAVHSGPEPLRHRFDARPSKKDLWETYLPAFEACVREGGVDAVMGAYNRVYGESASASKLLLKDILRGQWGFKGHIVSDCGAVSDICGGHAIVKSGAEAAALAIKNGLTYECGSCFRNLKSAVEQNLVTEAEVTAALVNQLMTRYRLGDIEKDPDCPYNNPDPKLLCSEKHRALARRAARESMVLLKNDGVLPLDSHGGFYGICGPSATDIFSLIGNYYGVNDRMVSYYEGIVGAVDPDVHVTFAPGCLYGEGGGTAIPYEKTVIAVIGNTGCFEGEEGDALATGSARGDRRSLRLSKSQMNLVNSLKRCKRRGQRVITVITGGSPVELKDILEASHAVVMAWYGGEEGGNALGDLLFGKADFTARLPITFPENDAALPPFESYAMAGRTYKYMTQGIARPFGFGLSYAKFEGAVKTRAKTAAGERVDVTVKNVSKRDGTAVVQLYASTENAGKGAPLKSLVAFRRVPVKAGATVEASFDVPAKLLVEYAEDGVAKPATQISYSIGL